MSASVGNAGVPANNVTQRCIMRFKPSDLNDGTTPAEGFLGSQKVTYKGDPSRVMNGLSDSFKVDVVAGQVLEVCKNQYIDHRKYDVSKNGQGEKVVRAHFKLVGEGEHTDCACGACCFTWHFEEDTCDCEQQDPIDPGKEGCSIQ